MKAISNIRALMAILIFFFSFSFVSCTEETLDYNNPDVDLFVKQLKAGKYSVESPEGLNTIPRFTVDDIGDLLKYAEVETIHLGQNASMGCKMVHVDAENYEGIYFLSDDEVLDASARYRRWWENRKYPRTMWTIDPCYDEPLCGSGYMWW